MLPVAVAQQRLEVCGGNGSADQKALRLVAVMAAQERELLRGLDALGNDFELELAPESDDRGADLRGVLLAGQILDEGPVDLEGADRQLAQITQR